MLSSKRSATKPRRSSGFAPGLPNKSDLGGVLQTNNIHIAVCDTGNVTQTLAELKASPSTTKAKAKFVLATDGSDLEAEDLTTGENDCLRLQRLSRSLWLLPAFGGYQHRQAKSAKARLTLKRLDALNRLYVELLKDNPEWGTAERRHDMNHFMARLIFCFFAEDTDNL